MISIYGSSLDFKPLKSPLSLENSSSSLFLGPGLGPGSTSSSNSSTSGGGGGGAATITTIIVAAAAAKGGGRG